MKIPRRMLMQRITAASSLLLLTVLAGCSGSTGTNADSGMGLSGELTIYAAASLKSIFDELAADFAAAHPGLTVNPINYDGSSSLALQIIEGAPVDVFAAADEHNMAKVTDADLTAGPQVFAANTLTLVVPAGNPGGVTALADLANSELDVVLCDVEVPCGNASQQLLRNAGINASVDSYEQNVAAVLTKVANNEADAGLVYVTDATGNPGVEIITVPGAEEVVNRYPITALSGGSNPDAAQDFVAYVLSAEAAEKLAARGFGIE